MRCRKLTRILCCILCSSILKISLSAAAPVLNEVVLNANSDGVTVGTFDGGGAQLTAVSNLIDTSAAPREYVAQVFTPSKTGTYVFGLSKSNQDTVLVVYSGDFDPFTPSARAIILNDDADGAGAGGVVMNNCGINAMRCPKITMNLTGGNNYSVVVTSYLPAQTVSDGVNFYVFGEPVLIGSSSIAETVGTSIRLDLRNVITDFLSYSDLQADQAVERHISKMDRLAKTVTKNQSDVMDENQPNFMFEANDDRIELGLEGDIVLNEFDRTTTIFSQSFSHIRNKNKNSSTNGRLTFSFERLLNREVTLGNSIGVHYNKVQQKFPGEAKNSHTAVSFGTYRIKNISPKLLSEWHLRALFGDGEVKSANTDRGWQSTFQTQAFKVGNSILGRFKTNIHPQNKKLRSIEIWPKFIWNYGIIKAKNLNSLFKTGSNQNEVNVLASDVKVFDASFGPILKFRNKNKIKTFLGDTLTISPAFQYSRIKAKETTLKRGALLDVYFSNESDGMRTAQMRFEKSNLSTGASIWAGFNLKF